MASQSSVKVWLLASRPKTLTSALVPVLVGTGLAYATHGYVRMSLSVLAFLSALFIQVGTNLVNDAMDFKKGADTAERLGPKRVTQTGMMNAKWVLLGGLTCFLISVLFAIPLVLAGGWPMVWIGLFSILCGYIYTGGPYPLAYIGMGDLFVLIFFGWVATGGVYYLNTGVVNIAPVVAGLQVGLLATVLIAVNNLRDHVTDSKANKWTLAARYGPRFARAEIAALVSIPFLSGAFWYVQGFRWAGLLPLLVFPLGVRLVRKIYATKPGVVYNQFLAQAAALHLVFGVLLSLGFLIR